MIPGQHYFLRFQDRYPAGGLQGLAGFIYHYGMVSLVPYGIVVGAYQGGGDHLRFGDKVVNNILLRVTHFFHDLAGFIKQRLALFPFCFTKTAFVFMRHIPELIGLFLQALDFLYAAVFRHFTIKCKRHQSF